MLTFQSKAKIQKTFHMIQSSLVLLTLLSSLHPEVVQAHQIEPIQTSNLSLTTQDIARVEFGYHYSSFESQDIEYKLDVKAGILTDGNIKLPLSSLTTLLSGLHGMYPGTRPVSWQNWSDDYPHAWVYLYLNDGKMVEISSDSQFDGMFPWNVSLWGSKKATQPDEAYIQLHSTLLDGINALWRKVDKEGFPRGRYSASFWQEMLGNPAPDTVKFSGADASDTAPIWGSSPASLNLFLPELNQNSEIKALLNAGYTIYDAAFTLEVQTKTLKPIKYSGTLALATPDGKDVVIGLVTLPFAEGQPVTTSLNATKSMQLVEQRRAGHFLNEADQILTHLTFLLDTRDKIERPMLSCPENRDISLDGQIIQAIWNPARPMRITFYPLTNQRWSIDLGIQRTDPNWSDATVQMILRSWFPESIAALSIEDIQAFDSKWKFAFQPNVTLRDPQLLEHLASGLPKQIVIHKQNPEKTGDYGFLSLDGRVVVSENGTNPVLVYCGITLPDYYSPPYPVEQVTPPNEQVPRQDMPNVVSKNGKWHTLNGSLPQEEFKTNWTSIAFTQPGFLHILWANERDGVYYADGWIDGTGWSAPQRLGDDAYWLNMRAWPDGEIHLFWDAGLTTRGSIHVWRPANGVWQKAEHWPGIAYFNQILRDSSGVLHIGSIESDGLDSEFMHRTWSADKGLSTPENISRQMGNTGNTSPLLRLDSKGQLHAAWSHILEQKAAPDPITGETSDIAGVYYAYQQSDGRWSKPEKIGTLAVYAHAMSMELDAQGNPLIVWQSDNGLISRIKKNGVWEDSIELEKVSPPETPAEFGPERWVQPTADLQSGVNTHGQIIVGWIIPSSGLKLAFWSDTQWTNIIEVIKQDESRKPELGPLTLQMTVDNYDQIHLVFFENDLLNYTLYDNRKIETKWLPVIYSGYGVPEASLLVDTAGSVAVLGLPRSPIFNVKMPPEGIPSTPTPMPIMTPSLIFTPESTLTPVQPLNKNSGFVPLIVGLGILFTLIAMGRVALRFKKKSSQTD